MNPVVDRFVISEATETFSGNPNLYIMRKIRKCFAEFADKIIHVVVDDTLPDIPMTEIPFRKMRWAED